MAPPQPVMPYAPHHLRAALFALGCRLNQAELGHLAEQLRGAGFVIVPWGEPADLLIFNSCTVTAAAARKTRNLVHRARREHPNAFLVLTGCDATLATNAWAEDGVADLVVPNPDKHHWLDRLPDRLRLLPRAPTPRAQPTTHNYQPATPPSSDFTLPDFSLPLGKTRANLKIQEGCSCGCAYCIIPQTRGGPRSREFADALREVRELIEHGVKEIILTGINLGLYESGGRRLPEFLDALTDIPGEFRVRLSSLEPGPWLPAAVERLARRPDRFCPHLHLPIQYAEDRILAAMRRTYTFAEFATAVTDAVRRVPGLSLGTDVIAGFPGETDEIFAACLANLGTLPLAYLHAFHFSARDGTVAASMPAHPPSNVVKPRVAALEALSRICSDRYVTSLIGQTVTVLTEAPLPGGGWRGTSEQFLEVHVPDAPAATGHNQFLRARITAPADLRRALAAAGRV